MNDDHDSVERSNSIDARPSKRDRLKGAISRTKIKIDKLKEDREARKQTEEKKSEAFQLSDDVNDFLSAGRVSTASDRPSTGSTASVEADKFSAPTTHSVPSIQYPRLAHPPRRKPVPKIDVSVPSRFSGAQLVTEGYPPDNDTLRPIGGTYLNPGSRPRSSQSSISHGISEERRARIRGLSVGFAEVSPVVIGEGGDECEMPVTEISRIKARARSESPGRRRPYTGTIADGYQALRTPLSRLPTGFGGQSEAPGPSLLQRTADRPALLQRVSSNGHVPAPVQRAELAGHELQKEFEMTLGSYGHVRNPSLQIVAPKPLHPPPSYQIIENGQLDESAASPTLSSRRSQVQYQAQTSAQPPLQVSPPAQSAYQSPRFRDPEQRTPSIDPRAQYFPPISSSQYTQSNPASQQQTLYPQTTRPSNQPDQSTPYSQSSSHLHALQPTEGEKTHLRRRSPTGPQLNSRPTSRDRSFALASSSYNDNKSHNTAQSDSHNTCAQSTRSLPNDDPNPSQIAPPLAPLAPPALPPRPPQAR